MKKRHAAAIIIIASLTTFGIGCVTTDQVAKAGAAFIEGGKELAGAVPGAVEDFKRGISILTKRSAT